jgi:hypothetical protein
MSSLVTIAISMHVRCASCQSSLHLGPVPHTSIREERRTAVHPDGTIVIGAGGRELRVFSSDGGLLYRSAEAAEEGRASRSPQSRRARPRRGAVTRDGQADVVDGRSTGMCSISLAAEIADVTTLVAPRRCAPAVSASRKSLSQVLACNARRSSSSFRKFTAMEEEAS